MYAAELETKWIRENNLTEEEYCTLVDYIDDDDFDALIPSLRELHATMATLPVRPSPDAELKKLKEENAHLLKVIKQMYDAMKVTWEYSGDPYGIWHNDAVDAYSAAEVVLKDSTLDDYLGSTDRPE